VLGQTIVDALTKVIVPNGGTVRDIAWLCAFARERCQGTVLRGLVLLTYGVGWSWGSGWGWWNRTHLITVRDHYYHAENCLVDILGEDDEPEHTWAGHSVTCIVMVSIFCCTVLSHTANCCGRDKLNCTASQTLCPVDNGHCVLLCS
jgi:hypothetical protein